MPEVFSAQTAVELAVLERSGFPESRHVGSAAVVASDGALIASLGDVAAPVFARSTLKPYQAIASLLTGAELTDEQLAIACASHTGTFAHMELANSTLAAVGLDEQGLRCPADWPGDGRTRTALVKADRGPHRLAMNCSGKHAAMLNACVHAGWPLDSYLDEAHPLQVQVREVIERLTSERPAAVGVDGCGAPVFALSLEALARGYARLATASDASPFPLFRHAARVAKVMRAHGWVIEGPGRPNTVVIDELGVIAKLGAEGVTVMAAPDGTAVALKVLDGNGRATSLIGLELLAWAGAVLRHGVDAVLGRLDLDVLGGGVKVGSIVPGQALRELVSSPAP